VLYIMAFSLSDVTSVIGKCYTVALPAEEEGVIDEWVWLET